MAGNPAKIIRQYDPENEKWVKATDRGCLADSRQVSIEGPCIS
jgi:hypothetical protein